jgi:8-oxo-dGTP pyrophosphatase MutT (NUDIX family)
LKIDFVSRCLHPEFLLVQRKDSMAFVEFVRGKYIPDDSRYVQGLVAGMTADEQEAVKSETHDLLWRKVWGKRAPNSARCGAELAMSRRAHEALVALWGGSLEPLVASVPTCLQEREFGFPKGRKCGGETDMACAVREFQEETGMDASCIHVYCLKPQEEVFEGGNGVLYRHVYYLARIVDMRGGPVVTPRAGSLQAQEVSSVQWASFAEMCDKFEMSSSRLSVAKRANADIFRVLDPDPECVTFNAMVVPGTAEEPSSASDSDETKSSSS